MSMTIALETFYKIFLLFENRTLLVDSGP